MRDGYVNRQTCQKRNKIAVFVWTSCHTDLLSARLRRKQRSTSIDRMRLLQTSRDHTLNNAVRSSKKHSSSGQNLKLNQITFIVTSPQHKCLGEWNSYERAPDSAKKTTTIYIWTVHIYRLYRRQCAKYTYIYSVHIVYYKDILNYQLHIIHRMGTSTLCTVSIHYVVYTQSSPVKITSL